MHKHNDFAITPSEDLYTDDMDVGPAIAPANRLNFAILRAISRATPRPAPSSETAAARAPVQPQSLRPSRVLRAIPFTRALIMALPFMLADVLALAAGTLFAFSALRLFGPLPIGGIHYIMPLLAMALVIGYSIFGMYAIIGVNPVVELRQLTRLNTLVFLAILIATYVVSAQPFWREFFTVQWVAMLLLVPVFRAAARWQCAGTRWWGQPALVFGPILAADAMARLLAKRPCDGLKPIALVCDHQGSDDLATCGLPVINTRTAKRLARRSAISYGVIVTGANSTDREAPLAAVAGFSLPHVLLTSGDTNFPTLWSDSREFGGMHALAINNRLLLPWPRFIKRVSDLILTTVGGILILPILVAVALAVKITSPGPIFFAHTRIGRGGHPFKAWKFRTMKPDAAAVLEHFLAAHPELRQEWECDHKLRNDPRITSLGRVLRKTSLDELPQLWNVLCAEMSLVGPRPIVDEEIEKYGEIFVRYKLVRPGITGLWQVSGRNNTSYQERVRLDDYYVHNWSPWLDLHLLAQTVRSLLSRDGAY